MSSRARFQERLEEARQIHLGARVIAYHMIGISPVVDLTRLVFAGLRAERFRAQTSAVTLYQLLTEPYRQGQEELAMRAFKYLSGHPGLEILPVSAAVARQAAEVQASLGGSAERSIQMGTALEGGARAYVAHKTALRRVAGLEMISLADFATG